MSFPCRQDDSRPLAGLAAELLESDAAYFEAGSKLANLPGAVLAWMEEFPSLSAAGVVHRVEGDLGGLAPGPWLSLADDVVRQMGRNAVRLYLTASHPELETTLVRRGYRPRTELGFLGRANPRSVRRPRRVSLRPVETERDWAAKEALHQLWNVAPDGHRLVGGGWSAMERRKAQAGYLQAYLAMVGPAICGTVALARRPGLDRVKNLVVHPDWTGRGIGGEIVALLAEAAGLNGRPVGLFALEGSAGEAIYRKLGLIPIVEQTEWCPIREP